MLLMLIAQAGQPLPAPAPLNLLATPPGCEASSQTDVTVCGRRDKDRYRIPPQYRTTAADEGLGRAETRVGNVGVAAQTEQVDINGWPSNRIMVRIKIPF